MTAKAPKNKANQPTPSPLGRKITLTKISHVRVELGRLYTEARRGSISTSEASKLANILAILARIIEGSDLEQRLTEIERHLQKEDVR